MSDQALVQSQADMSVEDRMANFLAQQDEPEQEEAEQPTEQENSEEATEAEAVDTQEEETEQVEATEEEAEPELVEVAVDGELYEVPPALKDKIMLQADYTRKTQEVAEQRKQVEQAQAQLQQAAQMQQQSLAEYAQLVALDNQLQAYNNVDWNALYEQDPAEFVRAKEAVRDLKDTRTNLASQITAQQQAQHEQQNQIRLQAIQEGQKVLAREIPQWNTELATTLNRFAVEKFGFTPEEVNQVIDPRVVKLLHKAYLHEKQVSNKPIAQKRVANLPKVTKPGSTQKQTPSQTAQQETLKALKKSGTMEAAQAAFLARLSK